MSKYFKKKLMGKLANEKIWLSAIDHQLEIGEIEMNEELQEMIQDSKREIEKIEKQLPNA